MRPGAKILFNNPPIGPGKPFRPTRMSHGPLSHHTINKKKTSASDKIPILKIVFECYCWALLSGKIGNVEYNKNNKNKINARIRAVSFILKRIRIGWRRIKGSYAVYLKIAVLDFAK